MKVGTGTYLELNWHGKLTTELIIFKMHGWTNSGLRNCWAKISKMLWYMRKETASQLKVKLIENHLWKNNWSFLRKENTFRQACHFLCYWILLKLACHIQLVTSKYCSAFYSREVGKITVRILWSTLFRNLFLLAWDEIVISEKPTSSLFHSREYAEMKCFSPEGNASLQNHCMVLLHISFQTVLNQWLF